jgi:uncharacterized protein with von Willebrand factor type A (vWA) domain
MSSLLPDIRSSVLPVRQEHRAVRAANRTQMAVFRRSLEAQAKSQIDQIESQALADVLRCSLQEEVGLLDEGRALANGDPAALELLSRKLQMQSRINNRRIERTFGV